MYTSHLVRSIGEVFGVTATVEPLAGLHLPRRFVNAFLWTSRRPFRLQRARVWPILPELAVTIQKLAEILARPLVKMSRALILAGRDFGSPPKNDACPTSDESELHR